MDSCSVCYKHVLYIVCLSPVIKVVRVTRGNASNPDHFDRRTWTNFCVAPVLLPVLWYHCTAISQAAKPMCVPILCPPEGRKVWSLWQVGFVFPHLYIGLLSNIHIFTALNVGLPIAVGPMQQMGPAPTTDFFIPRYKNKTPYYNMFLGTWILIEFCVHYNDDNRYWTTQNTVSQGMFS